MRHAVPHLEQSLFGRERQVKKDKLLRRLSAMQFAMWEMREFLDTHPNCPDAKALYNAYKEKYDTLARSTRPALAP